MKYIWSRTISSNPSSRKGFRVVHGNSIDIWEFIILIIQDKRKSNVIIKNFKLLKLLRFQRTGNIIWGREYCGKTQTDVLSLSTARWKWRQMKKNNKRGIVSSIEYNRVTPYEKRAQSLAGSWVTRIACAESVDPNSDILGEGLVHPQLVDPPSIFLPLRQGNPRVI